MAGAVYLFGLSSAAYSEERLRVFRKLLALYGPCYFESRLKSALLKLDRAEALVPDMRDALERAKSLGRVYLASQLLPPLARWTGEAVRPLLAGFSGPPARGELAPDPRTNVAEALGYLPGLESRRQLERMAQSPDRPIAEEARASLLRLSR
jgi:hypothetical protein